MLDLISTDDESVDKMLDLLSPDNDEVVDEMLDLLSPDVERFDEIL